MQQLVSIIIPTYNGADKICAAVDSVLNQTYENIEVIVVDDNGEGTENQRLTAKAMEKYRDNPKVQYLVHKVNKNGSAARNTGIRASKGEFLGFLDDDDLFLPEKTQKEVAFRRIRSCIRFIHRAYERPLHTHIRGGFYRKLSLPVFVQRGNSVLKHSYDKKKGA